MAWAYIRYQCLRELSASPVSSLLSVFAHPNCSHSNAGDEEVQHASTQLGHKGRGRSVGFKVLIASNLSATLRSPKRFVAIVAVCGEQRILL